MPLLEQLRAGVFTGNAYSLIHEFGEANLQEAIDTVASFLPDPDPDMRSIALSVLVLHWRRPEYRQTTERMLRDSDSDVRRMAVDALGTLTEGTRDPRALTLFLERIDDSSEEWDVRDAAYFAILRVLGKSVPKDRLLGQPMRWPEDADAEVLADARSVSASS